MDFFILAAEPSADLHGAKLIQELLALQPQLKIGAMAGPRMRALPIESLFAMESLQVMGFVDVIGAMPRILRQFFQIRRAILQANPKAVVCIDYPGFNLRLARSLRKKGYKGKLIHYICPSVWAWGKKRIPFMAKHLDLLLTIFPFEKAFFAKTSLQVTYVGHPLSDAIESKEEKRQNWIALFPGSRMKEVERNFPLQLETALQLQKLDPSLQIHVSVAGSEVLKQIQAICGQARVTYVPPEQNYELMGKARLALAKSGTVTLELALQKTPTVVHFAIRPLDLFLAQRIFRINLPFYCIANIVVSKQVFPELFGPHFTRERMLQEAKMLLFDEPARTECILGCDEVRKALGGKDASKEAAECILHQTETSAAQRKP